MSTRGLLAWVYATSDNRYYVKSTFPPDVLLPRYLRPKLDLHARM